MTGIGARVGSLRVKLPGSKHPGVSVAWGAVTDTGRKRAHNEDSFIAKSPIFAVADGMGGHAAGEVASDAVVRRLEELTHRPVVQPAELLTALRNATLDIGETADIEHLGIGTTVTGAGLCLNEGLPYWAVFNIGDSRLYLEANGEFRQVTVDHSVVQELVDAGLLAPEDAEHHPDSNVVTRALGFNSEPLPDFWLIPVEAGSRLLICSDGLTKELSGPQMRRILGQNSEAGQAAESLVFSAIEAGGRDNITAVVVDVISPSKRKHQVIPS
ncbi:MAG: serine/threonine-protein phosphatase [Cryobacterium sp.]|nr:serine/threonine-protein phosphatase [Cryobacterium sp.]